MIAEMDHAVPISWGVIALEGPVELNAVIPLMGLATDKALLLIITTTIIMTGLERRKIRRG